MLKNFIGSLAVCLFSFSIYGMDVKPRVVLITGCSSGIGLKAAQHLADQGYHVYAGVLNLSDCEALKEKPAVKILQLDITKNEEIQKAVDYVIQKEGRIDVLVNNAAYGLFGPLDSCTLFEIEHQFRVNVFGTIAITHAVLPHFRRQGCGKIICISSIRAFKSSSVQGAYSATKAALESIAASWASTLFPWNIQITVVEPGATCTSFPDHMIFGTQYKNQENPYPYILENSVAMVHDWNNDPKKAQDPHEIAVLIEKIIESERPAFRIQTNSSAYEEVVRMSQDPTGERWLEEERQLVSDWSQPPLCHVNP